jgi:hypothetical protein
MVLSADAKKMLEQLIEVEILSIPSQMHLVRRIKSELHLTTEDDYVYGYICGHIEASIDLAFTTSHNRPMNEDEEMDKIIAIVHALPRIQDAIFNVH